MKKRVLIEEYLENPLKELTSHLLPHQQFKSIHDLFNPDFFYSLFLAFLSQNIGKQVQQGLHEDANESYRQTQVRKFGIIWQRMIWVANRLDISLDERLNEKPMRQQIQQMLNSFNLLMMNRYVQVLFNIMLKNQKILLLITEMEQSHQLQIKQYIQSIMQSQTHKQQEKQEAMSPLRIQNRQILQQLQEVIIIKQQEISSLKSIKQQYQQDIQQYREQILQRDNQIGSLKKRILAYSEADLLFEEKDEEINKLQAQLASNKISTHLKIVQLTKQIEKYKETVTNIEQENMEMMRKMQKNSNMVSSLTVEKEESQLANKKVIQNLKQKINKLKEKNTQQQKSMIEMIQTKEEQAKKNKSQHNNSNEKTNNRYILYEQQQKTQRNSHKLGEELGQFSKTNGSMKEYYETLFGTDYDRCNGDLCIALRTQYVKIVYTILKILNDIQGIHEFTPESRIQCIQNYFKRIELTLQQNMKLKQKIVLLQSQRGYNKQSMQQINKLKKKLIILKRKLQQVQNQRKQELQIMISTFQQSIPLKS